MKYLAFLRGINVGGNKRVEMSKLKKVFENLGFQNVSTYINSGNVFFESEQVNQSSLYSKIEEEIAKTFGFSVPVITKTAKYIQDLAKAVPASWNNDTDQKTDVLFLWDKFDSKETLKLIKTNPDVDELIYLPGVIVWHIDKKYYNKSGMHKFIGTEVYKNMTARNINTVRKLSLLTQKT